MTELARRLGGAPFVFVAGKGGTGKTTIAGALALELADGGTATHLVSTDPAHSLRDLFGDDAGVGAVCGADLFIEELDADRYAASWLERVRRPVAEIIERGSYLDAEDVDALTRLALPGVDELMAVLRLVELADGGRRVVVDTAPTGHTLRLLDAAAAHAALAEALRALADKALTVAASLTGSAVRLAGESVIEELDRIVAAYRTRVLGSAAFVLATRAGAVVEAETRRLAEALRSRGLQHAATVWTGSPPAVALTTSQLFVPFIDDPRGCDGLRRWRAALGESGTASLPDHAATAPPEPALQSALPWLTSRDLRLLVFTGKGGVGKTTCAAAAALALAESRPVLLCSADPAGSLADVLGGGALPAGLRTMQIDATARMTELRERYRDEVSAALDDMGIGEAVALDRRVLETIWELAPPGIDEFAALAAILEAAAGDETIVLDTAPTGHFLRLLATPQIALDWTRQLMRLLVKYRAVGAAGSAAQTLLHTARELRALNELLKDATRTGVIVVALDEPLVRAESRRLLGALAAAGVNVQATLHNRWRGSSAAAADRTALFAPLHAAPVGVDALREFVGSWKIG